MIAPTPVPLAADQVRTFRERGFCIAEGLLGDDWLELLRASCAAAIGRIHARMDAEVTDVLGINHRGKRYFSAHPSLHDPDLYRFIASDLMVGCARQLLGESVYTFWEQYVVKAADVGMRFAWHQDSGYVGGDVEHAPYLTCWCALDDVHAANGTISVLPFDRMPHPGPQEHVRDPESNDLVGYRGDDPGELVEVPAGSVAFFTSHTLHRSGPNRTERMRRTYLIQYSPEPIPSGEGRGSFWGRAEPLLVDGRRVLGYVG